MNIRHGYDLELEELSEALIRMGNAVTDAMDKAIIAFSTNDNELAEQIKNGDGVIDEMERNIEQRCMSLLLKQQPVASDLRKVSTAIKMITDIERIGDAASDIAEICVQLNASVFPGLVIRINDMALNAINMASDAIRAYVEENLELALEIKKRDDEVDEYFIAIRAELCKALIDNPGQMEAAMDCLMIIKYLERVGDHAVNISEWVEFYKTGVHKRERIL